MKRSLTLLASMLTLAACATPTWQKPGVTVAEAERDSADCQRQAEASMAPSALPASQPWLADPWVAPRQWPLTAQSTQATLDSNVARYAEQHRLEQCMQARGYRLGTR